MKKVQVPNQDLKNNLKNIMMLKYLDDKELDHFLKICEVFEVEKNERIVTEGETNSYLYAVLKGIVTVKVTEKSGKEIYICSIAENEIFGESALFINVKRTANVLALDKALIVGVDRKNFIAFIQENPKGGVKVLMLIIHSLLQKLREANQDLAVERKYNFNQAEVDQMLGDLFEE